MSWATHDVEGWSHVCYESIAQALEIPLDASLEEALVGMERHPKVFDALMELAMPYIDGQTGDYLLGKAGVS